MPKAAATTTPCRRPRGAAATGADGDPHEPLAARLAAKDHSAIAEVYHRYGGRILGLALHVLHDRQLAEEVLQETVLRAWRRADTFDASRSLEPWLFTIARNAAYDLARSRARHPAPGRGDPDRALHEIREDDRRLDPVDAYDDLALRWDVRRAIDTLPDDERVVVRLQHLEGRTHREIAERLGISIGTVKSRSHRAHRRLAEALHDRKPGTVGQR